MRTAFFAVVTVAILACSSNPTGSNGETLPPAGSDVLIVSSASTKGARAYSPDTIRISKAKQSTITWSNGDGTAHVLTGVFFEGFQLAVSPGGNHVEEIGGLPSGSWEYHCAIHPTMVGRIIITP